MTPVSAARWAIALVTLTVAAALAAGASGATAPTGSATPAAPAAAMPGTLLLRLRIEASDVRQVQRVARTDNLVKTAQGSERIVTEVVVRDDETTVTYDPAQKAGKIVLLETPSPERRVSHEMNGQERIADVPEAARLRNLAPVLSTQMKGLRNEVIGRPEKAPDPPSLIDMIVADLRVLPEEPVSPGKTWTRQADYGIAKVVYTEKCTGIRPLGDKAVPCADLETSATVTLAPELAARLTFDKIESKSSVAGDGSGAVSFSALIVASEKADKAETTLSRSVQEQLVQTARLDGAAFQKMAVNLARVETILDHIKTGDLDAAMGGLDEFLKADPQGPWSPAIQVFRDSVAERQILTRPTAPFRLRLLLRDLQADRDRAASQGAADQVAAIDRTLRQLATVNAKTLEADTADMDPVVRDMAAFGLTFSPDPAAGNILAKLTQDASAQVRGTAAVGLAIVGRGVDAATLERLLSDADARIQGAGALLAPWSVKRDDPQAARFPPIIVKGLGSSSAWTRVACVSALAAITPAKQTPAVVAALVAAAKTETEPRLQPTYWQALRTLTGVDGTSLQPFEEWMAGHPAAGPLEVLPPLPLPAAPVAVTPTAPVATPTAPAVTGSSVATPTTAPMVTPTSPSMTAPKTTPMTISPVKPMQPPTKAPGITMSAPTPTMAPLKAPDIMSPAPTPTLPAPSPAPSPTADKP